MIKYKCCAKSVGQPRPPTKRFFKSTGKRTKNAAPANEPKIDPNPPIITMKRTKNDFSIPKASVTSIAPK